MLATAQRPLSDIAQPIFERLSRTSERWWLVSFACRMALLLAMALAIFFTCVLLDVWLQFGQRGLLALSLAWLGVTLALAAWLIVGILRRQWNLEATARHFEVAQPELGNDVINVVQLAAASEPDSTGFRAAAVADAMRRLETVPFETRAVARTRWQRLVRGVQVPRDLLEHLGLLFAVCLLGVVLMELAPAGSSVTRRLLRPWEFVPQEGAVKILDVTPGNAEVLAGTSLEISARIENPSRRSYPATLVVIPAEGSPTKQGLLANETNDRFVAAIPAVLQPIQYRIEIGDSQSPQFTVRVFEKPTVESADVTYEFPAYMGRANETAHQKHADLKAPQFATADLQLRATTAIARGFLMVDDRKIHGEVLSDGRTLRVKKLLDKSTSYTVHLFNQADYTDPEPRPNRIEVISDRPPSIQLLKPPADSTAAADQSLAIALRAADDYGLAAVRVETKVVVEENGIEQAVSTSQRWDRLGNLSETTLSHALILSAALVKPGQSLFVRAVATDGRAVQVFGASLAPQETASEWHRVRLVSAEARAAERLTQLDAVRAQIWRILQLQLRARVAAAGLDDLRNQAAYARMRGQVRTQQIDVQTTTTELVQAIAPDDDEERRVVRRVLNNLSNGPMLAAVRQAEALTQTSLVSFPDEISRNALASGSRSDSTSEPGASAPRLMESPERADGTKTDESGLTQLLATQNQIIETLRRLLDVVRAATAESLAEMKDRRSGDLPDDTQQKLRDLKDKLAEFLEQQKKVIEASENLAKIPVEDFTETEEQILKDLAKAEDDWSQFMAEAHADLSKLPEQDFANPSLMQELVEIQNELKMAADALTMKTADIAVPLEQLGAEMAEEMTTNIEKWLPDTPDRERWSQEEPLTDEMKEAPMAELPGELEDLVGDLMEEEEDLFDEMEDASSSWADSIDKGAGWDAMDGPISNMSARGVTGNRLPNTSEIGGRSGEGRQGKSSGEFVGDTAVGKGGRKTPSRLTPDPYVKGQVKDLSKDPTGGATGGGKESGQGGEGLEGPAPNRPPRDLERLAGKQADLRNKAEGVDLQFQVMHHQHTDLKKLIEQMRAVEVDLRSGRYQSAQRRRDVLLDGLSAIKSHLAGEFELRQDVTNNVPSEIQKDILGSMQDSSPSGWEDLNRRYFERLATGKSAAKAQPAEARDEKK